MSKHSLARCHCFLVTLAKHLSPVSDVEKLEKASAINVPSQDHRWTLGMGEVGGLVSKSGDTKHPFLQDNGLQQTKICCAGVPMACHYILPALQLAMHGSCASCCGGGEADWLVVSLLMKMLLPHLTWKAELVLPASAAEVASRESVVPCVLSDQTRWVVPSQFALSMS